MIVKLSINSDGYIDGWGSDYTSTNQYDIARDELDNLVIGATKLVDGHLVVDTIKQAELEAEANKPEPSPEQQMIAALTLEVAQLKAVKSSD